MIWLASYPKSGNTWMRTLLREYFKETEGAAPFESNDTATYWYQNVSPKPMIVLSQEDTAQLRAAAMLHLTTFVEGFSKFVPEALIKTHMACARYAEIPFFSPMWMERAVYIHRDPRDVLPSFASHIGVDLESAAEKMNITTSVLGKPPRVQISLSTWSNHVESWLGCSKVPVLPIGYEEMHESAADCLAAVLRFHSYKPDMDACERAVEESRFEKLQREEEEEGFHEKGEHNEKFFRRGIVGSHKDEVPQKLVEKIEEDHERIMKHLGYL